MTNLSAKNISFYIDKNKIINDVNLDINTGELVCLVGPNGAGKSSLMKLLLGLIKPSSGIIMLNGLAMKHYPRKEKAIEISYLPQVRTVDWSVSVYDVIKLGRYPHNQNLNYLNKTDKDAIGKAISLCGLENFIHRKIDTLSGGEISLVHCARAFASETPFLFADEIVASLDPFHEIKIMNILRDYIKTKKSALIIMHNLNLATHFADRIIWMKDGSILADGNPKNNLNPELVKETFGVQCTVNELEISVIKD